MSFLRIWIPYNIVAPFRNEDWDLNKYPIKILSNESLIVYWSTMREPEGDIPLFDYLKWICFTIEDNTI